MYNTYRWWHISKSSAWFQPTTVFNQRHKIEEMRDSSMLIPHSLPCCLEACRWWSSSFQFTQLEKWPWFSYPTTVLNVRSKSLYKSRYWMCIIILFFSTLYHFWRKIFIRLAKFSGGLILEKNMQFFLHSEILCELKWLHQIPSCTRTGSSNLKF